MTEPGEHWRLFVALPCPVDVRDTVEDVLAPVRAAGDHLRWVPPATWHLTLAFLGDVPAARVEVVADAVRTGVSASGGTGFDVELRGASRFGRGLLFLQVDDEAFAATVALGGAVREALVAADVEVDDKPLHPHLTLARQRDRRGRGVSRSQLDDVEAALRSLARGQRSWRADEVVLFRSHLGDGPVRHERVGVVPLA